jgi:predicted CopG family antitoxin
VMRPVASTYICPVHRCYRNMTATTIALDNEAYESLKSAKRPGESFSATVKRLARQRKPLSSFAGSWGHLRPREIEALRETVLTTRAGERARVAKHLRRGD